MKYTVEIQAINAEYQNLSKKEAIETAKEEAAKKAASGVYIHWYRKSDSQHGYLNPDGNHDTTGKDWSY